MSDVVNECSPSRLCYVPFNQQYLRELLRYGRKWDGPWDEHSCEDGLRDPDEDDAAFLAASPLLMELLSECHYQLHRLVTTFVSDRDGAYKQTTDLMSRIRNQIGT